MDAGELNKRLAVHKPSILGSETFSKFAVLLPLVEKEDGLHILFEERAHTLKRQPGDICFPGGRVDPDDRDEKQTAIRETMEELGLNRSDIGDLYPLDYIVTPFGTKITPFAGYIHNLDNIQVNQAEVASIFTVPLAFFIEHPPRIFQVNYKIELDEQFPLDLIIGGKNYDWQPRKMDEYFYRYENRVIWGLTARILTHFLEAFCQSK